MSYIDHANDYHELQERYAQMSDEQIARLWAQIDDFTEFAKGILRAEVSKRGLEKTEQVPEGSSHEITKQGMREGTINNSLMKEPPDEPEEIPGIAGTGESEEDLAARDPELQGLDPTAFDLIRVWTVSSISEAREVMHILQAVGVQGFLGSESAEKVDDYKGRYEDGVDIKVMKFQQSFVIQGLRNYLRPRPDEEHPSDAEYELKCPHCSSSEVILEGFRSEPGKESPEEARNRWRCDSCGHDWEDDGLVMK